MEADEHKVAGWGLTRQNDCLSVMHHKREISHFHQKVPVMTLRCKIDRVNSMPTSTFISPGCRYADLNEPCIFMKRQLFSIIILGIHDLYLMPKKFKSAASCFFCLFVCFLAYAFCINHRNKKSTGL